MSIEKGVWSVIVVEPSLGGSPSDDDDEERDESEEVGEELGNQLVFWLNVGV